MSDYLVTVTRLDGSPQAPGDSQDSSHHKETPDLSPQPKTKVSEENQHTQEQQPSKNKDIKASPASLLPPSTP